MSNQECVLVQGLATPFDRASAPDASGVRDLFQRGAFAASLMRGDVGFWVNHLENPKIVRRMSVGVFSLIETDQGLLFSALIKAPTMCGFLRRVRRHVRGCSVGWEAQDFTTVGGLRRIRTARLFEVSVLVGAVEPRFPGTFARID